VGRITPHQILVGGFVFLKNFCYNQNMFNVKTKIILIGIIFLLIPLAVSAFSVGDVESFYTEKDYDFEKREEVSAMLVRITNQLLFYIEEEWWEKLEPAGKGKIAQAMIDLSAEFERKIYPELTSAFGHVPEHPADKSGKISVLFHRMKKDAGGYFRTGDQYLKLQYPLSNERNIIYLNISRIEEPLLPSYLAHEFIHLITFNQKQNLRNVSEETWLEELRAEFAPSFLNYNKEYKDSYLEKRVKVFLDYPGESLVRWRNRLSDYGVINLFAQYLVDHYGVEILLDSLHSNKTGIESINYALAKNNFQEDFAQVFTDWTVALLINDCDWGEKYCYLSPDLKDLKIVPRLYYLPSAGEPFLRLTENIFNWSANWNKIIGGKGDLVLKIEDGQEIIVPYVLCDYQEKCEVGFLKPDQNQREIIFFDFEEKYYSLTIILLAQPKSNPDVARTFQIIWSAEAKEVKEREEPELINRLLAEIEELKRQIAEVRLKINAILTQKGTCTFFKNNLYYGMRDNAEVSCLQEFLKAQGTGIYPEGLVTGNFLSLTQQAVIRFQERYIEEILAPLGLAKGTGYVGQMTRTKLNELLISGE